MSPIGFKYEKSAVRISVFFPTPTEIGAEYSPGVIALFPVFESVISARLFEAFLFPEKLPLG